MPINLEGCKHNQGYEKGYAHKFKPIRVWAVSDIFTQLYAGCPSRNKMDRLIGHAKERNDVWVCQTFRLGDRLHEVLLDQESTGQSRVTIVILTMYLRDELPIREGRVELLGANFRPVQQPFADDFIRPDRGWIGGGYQGGDTERVRRW